MNPQIVIRKNFSALAATLKEQGYTPDGVSFDREFIEARSCKCGTRFQYRAFSVANRYRAFGVCERCNAAREFWEETVPAVENGIKAAA